MNADVPLDYFCLQQLSFFIFQGYYFARKDQVLTMKSFQVGQQNKTPSRKNEIIIQCS